MCTSFRLDPGQSAHIRVLIDEVFGKAPSREGRIVQESLFGRDLRPNDDVLAVRSAGDSAPNTANQADRAAAQCPTLMRWGFPGFKPGKLIVNARGETASSKPIFADALSKRRCLVPASGFHEWDADKNKYEFRLPDATELYLAGIFSLFRDETRCCILTTKSNSSVASIHDRMPVVIPYEQADEWLTDDEDAMCILHSTPPRLTATRVPCEPRGTNSRSECGDEAAGQMCLW